MSFEVWFEFVCFLTTDAIYYTFDNGRWQVQISNPTSQNLEAGQKTWMFGITKSRIINVFMLELNSSCFRSRLTHQLLVIVSTGKF
jgi:hypothetical protein